MQEPEIRDAYIRKISTATGDSYRKLTYVLSLTLSNSEIRVVYAQLSRLVDRVSSFGIVEYSL